MLKATTLGALTSGLLVLGASPGVALGPTSVGSAPKVKLRPSIRVSAPASVQQGADLALGLGRTTVPRGEKIVSYTVNFADGSRATAGLGLPKSVHHRYSHPGSYRIRVTLTDQFHHRTHSDRVVAVVAPTPVAPPVQPPPVPPSNANDFIPSATDSGNPSPGYDVNEQLGAGSYDNGLVADVGLSHVGQYIGVQCKQAVNDWVRAASNGGQRLGGGYFSDYRREGGTSIGRDDTAKGDVIQLNNPASLDGYKYGMHSAVVVSHQPGSNDFDVVDSNYRGDDVVRHHVFNPYAQASRFGLQVNFWRMGAITTVDPPKPPAAPAPQPGSSAPQSYHYAVSGAGSSGLRVRTGPGFSSYSVTRILPDQAGIDIVCQTRGERVYGSSSSSSSVWDQLTQGDWVSDWYVNTPNIDQFTAPIPQCGGSNPPPTGGGSTPTSYTHHVYGTCAAGACGLRFRTGPGTGNGITRTLGDGTAVDIVCQTTGDHVAGTSVWDRTTAGDYASDWYIDTSSTNGGFSPPIPRC